MQQTYTTTPLRNKFNTSGLRSEDRIALNEGIDEILEQVPEKCFASLIYHNIGQTQKPPSKCTYKPFEIIITLGTYFNEKMKEVQTYSLPIVVQLFIHENKDAQQEFFHRNPLLFNEDSSYSKQVLSIIPN